MRKTTAVMLLLPLAWIGCEDPAADVPTAEVVETPAEDVPPPEEAIPDGPLMPPGALSIDTDHSTLEFVGSKVTGSHSGHFNEWSGYIALGEPVEQTRVSVTIQMVSVEADRDRLTTHLRSDDFFDVPNHPTATFETLSFEPAPADGVSHTVTARLTLRGATHTIAVPVNLEVSEQEVRARTEFSIDRQRWGVSYPGREDDLIRDQVVIRFDVRAPRG